MKLIQGIFICHNIELYHINGRGVEMLLSQNHTSQLSNFFFFFFLQVNIKL